jgi:hypothetical protein
MRTVARDMTAFRINGDADRHDNERCASVSNDIAKDLKGMRDAAVE